MGKHWHWVAAVTSKESRVQTSTSRIVCQNKYKIVSDPSHQLFWLGPAAHWCMVCMLLDVVAARPRRAAAVAVTCMLCHHAGPLQPSLPTLQPSIGLFGCSRSCNRPSASYSFCHMWLSGLSDGRDRCSNLWQCQGQQQIGEQASGRPTGSARSALRGASERPRRPAAFSRCLTKLSWARQAIAPSCPAAAGCRRCCQPTAQLSPALCVILPVVAFAAQHLSC